MDEYRKVEPTVRAVQWDGTIEDAERIAEYLKANGEGDWVEVRTRITAGLRPRPILVFPTMRRGLWETSPLAPNDWVVIIDGKPQPMYDEEFQQIYRKVES